MYFQNVQVVLPAQSQYTIFGPPPPSPPPLIFVPPTPLFQWVRLGLQAGGRALRLEQAKGPSAAARIGQGAERCGQRMGEGYKNEGRGGGPEIQYWENPVLPTLGGATYILSSAQVVPPTVGGFTYGTDISSPFPHISTRPMQCVLQPSIWQVLYTFKYSSFYKFKKYFLSESFAGHFRPQNTYIIIYLRKKSQCAGH